MKEKIKVLIEWIKAQKVGTQIIVLLALITFASAAIYIAVLELNKFTGWLLHLIS